jgi:hypothetical protein
VSDFTARTTKPKNQDREALIEEIARIVDADPSILEGVQKLLPQDAKHITINIKGLQGIEWVILRGHSGGNGCG